MIEIVSDPWPQMLDDPIVYSLSKSPQVESSYYIRLNGITFKLNYQDMITLRNRISSVIRDREFNVPL
jgi:hypothetical protein